MVPYEVFDKPVTLIHQDHLGLHRLFGHFEGEDDQTITAFTQLGAGALNKHLAFPVGSWRYISLELRESHVHRGYAGHTRVDEASKPKLLAVYQPFSLESTAVRLIINWTHNKSRASLGPEHSRYRVQATPLAAPRAVGNIRC